METLSKNPTNPLVIIRESIALSQDDLANSAGITRQIVTMTEAGIYSEIPPAILNALSDDFGIDTAALNLEYKKWVTQQICALNVREITSIERISELNKKDILHVRIPVGIKSFREWRNVLCESNGYHMDSLSSFARMVKIQPVTIRKYETGKTKKLPVQLVERLQDWGFPQEYINELAALPIGRKQ